MNKKETCEIGIDNTKSDVCFSSEDIVNELNSAVESLGFVNTIPWREHAPYLDHSRTPWRDFMNGPRKY